MTFFKTMLYRYARLFFISLAALLLVETAVLYYLNNRYFDPSSGQYSLVRVTGDVSSMTYLPEVVIPSVAENISCSHDGRYLAYTVDKKLYVVDMTDRKTYAVGDAKGMMFSYYEWVYDRDRLIIAEKNSGGRVPCRVKMYYYDLKDKELTEIRDNMNNVDYFVELSDPSDEVTDIDMSTATTVTYFKVTTAGGRSKIYELNVTVSLDRKSAVTTKIGKIQCIKNEDILYYENKENNKIYRSGSSTSVSIDGNRNLRFLGFDDSDNAYIAAVNDVGLTSTIYCGDLPDRKFNRFDLGGSYNPDDILVNYKGMVFINDKTHKTLISVFTQPGGSSASSSAASSAVSPKPIQYTGDVVSIYDSGFITRNSGVIRHYKFT